MGMPMVGACLDHIAGDDTVGRNGDANAAARLVGTKIAEQISGDGRKTPADIEIGDGDAGRRVIDGVVGNTRRFRTRIPSRSRPRPSRVQVLPVIWMLFAELPRMAENAALSMRLPRTITLPARNTMMALP